MEGILSPTQCAQHARNAVCSAASKPKEAGDFSILVKFCRNGAQQIAPRKARNE
jgi:hypothetical protein